MKTYHNPIIRGYHPDPSMCIVGKDAYLVTSTFEFFPGVPIFHSTNLVDWDCIGHCLTTDSQLPLADCRCSGGIFAPTIRYHDGTFYMITTNVTAKGNFIVYTDDIRGTWSEPQWIDHRGIDPSLLFDDDGKVYYCGTGDDENGTAGIVVFEINPKTGEILSDKKIVSHGFCGKYPEAPHLYKKDGTYYLMMAEGGTEYGHMETIFRSDSVWGPFESCPHNPIISNRDAMGTRVQCIGHADLAEDANGNWWLCCLGVRRLNDRAMLHNLGRETFLVPVTWENGWPVAANGGVVQETMEGPLPGETPTGERSIRFFDDFSAAELNRQWNFVRNPNRKHYRLADQKLHLLAGSEQLSDYHPTFVGIRQPEFTLLAETELELSSLTEQGRAGITAFYSMENHYALSVERDGTGYAAVLRKRVMDMDCVEERIPLEGGQNVRLQIEAGETDYLFRACDRTGWKMVGSGKAAGLCTEATSTMTFTGTYLGLFAVDTDAIFTEFSMESR